MMISLEEFLKIPKKDLLGKVFVFPTDTVYGIGAIFDDSAAINKIYDIKERTKGKPLAILISDFKQVENIVEVNNDLTQELINKYWPGPLTLIFKKKENFLYPYNTIGFRIPNSKVALKILNYLGPLATTSVNYSGEEPINDINEIEKIFKGKIDYIIIDQETFSKTSSTVLDVTSNEIKVLRQGTIKL